MAVSHQAADEPITAINVTPLVDVSLVLVIIFMIAMPYLLEKAMKVSSSSDKVSQASDLSTPILVELSAGAVKLEGQAVDGTALSSRLKRLMQDRKVSTVALSAGRDVLHGRVVEVLDHIHSAGAGDVNVMQPEERGHGAR
ncbi:MAG: biopolymer transporter ExbD [Elusimicrobia bacterium]|nr:biopolymer transporter ExbD [Elusimicrobiota bacterium]